MRPRRLSVRSLYDVSALIWVAVILLGTWLYGGPPDQSLEHRASFQRGIDNVIGGMSMPQVVLEYGGIDDSPEINQHVEKVFGPVADEAEQIRPGLRYHISVLKSKVPNAFSLPGGRTFITRGLLEILDDDGEIAGVLGHELAHTVRSHGSKAFGRDLGMMVFFDFVVDRVDEGQREQAAELARLSHALVSTGYSREAETEADELGLALAIRAGFRPLGLPDALEQIEAYQKEHADPTADEVPVFFRTHPLTKDRVRNIRAKAKEMGYDVYVPGDPVTEALRRYQKKNESETDDKVHLP